MPETPSTLDGKVLLVYLRKPGAAMRAGIGLVNPKLETLWGEAFLTGVAPAHGADWASSLEVAVRWGEVAHFLMFDSLSEYHERVREAQALQSSSSQAEN